MNTPGRLHDRALELAAEALDFGLPPADAVELDRHLASCSACARTASALRGDGALLHHPATLLPSRRVDDAVYGAIAGRDPRTSPQRLLVLMAATFLLLVALMGVAAAGALILRTWQPTVVVPLPSPPVVIVDPSASWQVGPLPPMFEGREALPVAVAGGESGLAAVGGRVFRDREPPGGGTASAWHSVDGLTWEPVPTGDGLAIGDELPMDDEPMPGLADVAWGPGGFVATGIVIEGSDRVGGIWHSSDGLTWARTAVPDAAHMRPAAVAWNGSTYVAVGAARDEGSPRAAAWLSTDGHSWRRVPDSEAFAIGGYITYPAALGSGGLADVTAAPDGSLTAVGHACTATTRMEDQSVCRPIVLRSADGQSWSAAPGPDATGVGLSSVAASGTRYVATAGGPGGLRFVQAPGQFTAGAGTARVAVGDEAGWRFVEPAGVPSLDRVVAVGDRFLAVSTESNRITLWVSSDGATWTEVPDVPQPQLLPDWEADMLAFSDVELAVAANRVVITGRSNGSTPEWGAFAIAGPARLVGPGAETPAGSPAPSTQPSAAWRPAPSSLPVASGTAQLAPGPDGGMYVLATTANAGIAGRPGRSVLALLDRAGDPRPGWPIAVDGWSCANPYSGAWPPEVASDGSVTVACLSWADAGDSVRMTVSTFDASGKLVASWWYAGEPSGRPRVVDGRLLVIAREVKEQEVTLPDGQVDTGYQTTYWLDEVAGDGTTRRSGERLDLGDPGWPVVLGPDGTAYHENMADGEITAFDLDGLRPGWPVRLGGSLSALGFGPDGRVLVTVAAAGATRLVVLGAGGETLATSDAFSMEGVSGWSGAGPDGRPTAPLVGADGTSVVIGEADDHTVVFRIDSSGKVLNGWPYRADTAVQWQGTCPAETAGCGVWRAVAALGGDGTVSLPLAAPDAQIGGTLASVGPNGRDLSGWPMHLARRGAEFWSVAVASDGIVFALAVEPETGGSTSATILAVANDGTVLSRTTVIQP